MSTLFDQSTCTYPGEREKLIEEFQTMRSVIEEIDQGVTDCKVQTP